MAGRVQICADMQAMAGGREGGRALTQVSVWLGAPFTLCMAPPHAARLGRPAVHHVLCCWPLLPKPLAARVLTGVSATCAAVNGKGVTARRVWTAAANARHAVQTG